MLFDNDVQDVFVCGLGYDCAVGRTARDAAAYGTFPPNIRNWRTSVLKWFSLYSTVFWAFNIGRERLLSLFGHLLALSDIRLETLLSYTQSSVSF